MDALAHIKAYLKAHFGNHDIETLMTHFETAIEAKVEEAVEHVREEIQALRDDLMGGRPPPVTIRTGFNMAPGGVTIVTPDGQPAFDQSEKPEAAEPETKTEGVA